MAIAGRLAIVTVAVVVRATAGGFIGWGLGSIGGRYEQENVWLISLLIGAAVGAVGALAALSLSQRK